MLNDPLVVNFWGNTLEDGREKEVAFLVVKSRKSQSAKSINVTEEVAQLVNLYFGFSCGGAMVSVTICMLIYYAYQRRKPQ